jgi:hypothetical protein
VFTVAFLAVRKRWLLHLGVPTLLHITTIALQVVIQAEVFISRGKALGQTYTHAGTG